jgi:ribulose kinase
MQLGLKQHHIVQHGRVDAFAGQFGTGRELDRIDRAVVFLGRRDGRVETEA